MKNYCTIYSHDLGFNPILEEIEKSFPKGKIVLSDQEDSRIITVKIKGSFLKSDREFKVSYREKIKPSFQITDIEEPISRNLAGMMNFVDSLNVEHKKVKELLVLKIKTINCEFAVLSDGSFSKELPEFISKLSQKLDAILFVTPDSPISKSDTQHFVDKNLELILDVNGKSTGNEIDIRINPRYFDQTQQDLNEDQKNRKTVSEEILNEHKIKVNKNLPAIRSEEDVNARLPNEIAKRVVVLATANLVAFNNLSGKEALQYLKQFDLDGEVTPSEMSFFNDPTDEKKNQETWKCEVIWTLMWALGFIEDLGFPNEMADLNIIPYENYPIGRGKNPHDFIRKVTSMRSKSEILNANDLYYRMNWACVDARVNGNEINEVHPVIVYERHFALNWLVKQKNQEWDEVTCDT